MHDIIGPAVMVILSFMLWPRASTLFPIGGALFIGAALSALGTSILYQATALQEMGHIALVLSVLAGLFAIVVPARVLLRSPR